jgi:hypothetical protein
MKKQNIYIILLASIAALSSCKKIVPTLFTNPDGIYFNAGDSLSYTFAKHPNRLTDTLEIPVVVLGDTAGFDREINVETISDSDVNAKQGVDYKLLPPYKMPAGQVSTLIPVVIYRTGAMDSITETFILQLKANDKFESGITSMASLKVRVGYLQKPSTWGEFSGLQWAGYSTNFGTWTRTKYKLILDALYDPLSDTTVTEFHYSRFSPPANYLQYLQVVKNYIRTNYPGNYSTPLGVGVTLRDPDENNNVIRVGPANY